LQFLVENLRWEVTVHIVWYDTRGLFGYAVEKIMYIRTMWYIALVDILKWLQELAMR
jgi:hypothetical protein